MATFKQKLVASLSCVLLLAIGLILSVFTSDTAHALEPTATTTRGDAKNPVQVIVYSDPTDEFPFPSSSLGMGHCFSFSTRYRLGTRYFNGWNVGIELAASCRKGQLFTIKLYRNGSFVGSALVRRNGFSRVIWTNVGSGYYSCLFIKSYDGAAVSCSNVALFSW